MREKNPEERPGDERSQPRTEDRLSRPFNANRNRSGAVSAAIQEPEWIQPRKTAVPLGRIDTEPDNQDKRLNRKRQ